MKKSETQQVCYVLQHLTPHILIITKIRLMKDTFCRMIINWLPKLITCEIVLVCFKNLFSFIRRKSLVQKLVKNRNHRSTICKFSEAGRHQGVWRYRLMFKAYRVIYNVSYAVSVKVFEGFRKRCTHRHTDSNSDS